MKNFLFNGREYKVVNGLVHESGKGILDPVYRGDNVMLDAHCDYLNVKLYQRPSGIHAYGNQNGTRSK